ncbi:chromosome 21 open reading frame 129, isoform CRA_a [Homo sapiens]|uniref:Putative uncharacterized protein encoded by LINC00479 n=1 Tax=Homo sapiens TaxID=9606 RepID=CU129_HUMAN|nr:RecName: Full=Putative uncharacterized protein encoded by LINC00479 [Homo sapiens]EAX09593.1 chromosome 21 open reading frame 129, isoform CRA_a [Homo sapiens]EAX09594.1 chromosome 21 open reading frame 129, isoform CRA_a [Homo sapiens]
MDGGSLRASPAAMDGGALEPAQQLSSLEGWTGQDRLLIPRWREARSLSWMQSPDLESSKCLTQGCCYPQAWILACSAALLQALASSDLQGSLDRVNYSRGLGPRVRLFVFPDTVGSTRKSGSTGNICSVMLNVATGCVRIEK